MRIHSLTLIVILAAAGVFELRAQIASDSTPLDSLLLPDGTIRLDGGFQGSLDPSGFRMLVDPEGAPRFVRSTEAWAAADTLDSIYKNYPGDEFWSEAFGPPGTDGPIYAMAVLNGKLYCGGRFTVTGNTIAYNISQWDGRRWMALRGGVNGTVRAFAAKDGVLYVGGQFTTASGETVGGVARYYPSEDRWSALGYNVGLRIDNSRPANVMALAFMGDDLYVGGEFLVAYTRAGDQPIKGIVRWNGVFWEALGTGLNNSAGALATCDSGLVVAGNFVTAGGMAARGVALWTGSEWRSMAGGVTGPGSAVIVSGSDVYVGGRFDTAGGVAARNIARFDVRTWRWSAVGAGLDNQVLSLAMFGQQLFAGGTFRTASGATLNYIARYDGGAWADVAGGVSDTVQPAVNAMLAVDTALYVAGHFIVAGTVSAHHIARFDGSRWHALTLGEALDVDRNGTGGAVYALAVHGTRLYVGGDFEQAGGIAARRVAMWDGEEWSPLGTGIGGRAGFVRALAVADDGTLYAGGIFEEAGGVAARGIARWDGVRWSAIAGGIGGRTPYVFSLLVEGDTVFTGGAFTEAGGIPCSRVAAYRRSLDRWGSLGRGVAGDSSEYVFVSAMARYQGDLVVGGDFARADGERARRIAAWDGRQWRRVAEGPDSGASGTVHALAVHEGQLVAGGNFNRVGTATAAFLAAFDGRSWSSVATAGAFDGPVRSLRSYRGALVVGGSFLRAGNAASNHIIRIGAGGVATFGDGVNATVHATAEVEGVLYAGGDFTMAGRRKASYIAAWDETLWTTLGSDPTSGVYGIIRTVAVSGRDVYVGGAFSAVGGVRARNVARWDGQRWHSLGRGPNNGVDGTVLAIAKVGDRVFVGGSFNSAGDGSVAYLAQWDGTAWSDVGGGVSGNNPYVFALLADGDDLFVGGAFGAVGGRTAHRIARWNTRTGTWSVLDSGVSGGGYYTYVSALAGSSDDLYVGGNFAVAGADAPAGNIAHWNGTSWRGLGNGFNNSVFDIAVLGGRVYACGDFTAADGLPARYIASYDGAKWSAMEAGLNLPAVDLCVYQNELIVAGHFQMAGKILGMGIARWNGATWGNLGKGVQHGYSVGQVYGVDASDSGVYAGGNFTVAGGRASYYFGRWNRPGGTVTATDLGPPVSTLPRATIALRPNPASPASSFDVLASIAGRSTIEITTVNGVVVATIDCGDLAPGVASVPWSPGDLPAGHYVARLRTAGAEASTLVLVP